jgi:hypothetical protein
MARSNPTNEIDDDEIEYEIDSEIFFRLIQARVTDDGLNPDELTSAPSHLVDRHGPSEDQPQPSEASLQIAKDAQIPEANTKVFFTQVDGWVWQFRFASTLDADRRQFKKAVNEIKTTIKRLLRAFEYLDTRQYGSFTLNKWFEHLLYHEWPDLMECMHAFHRDKVSDPVCEAVLKTLPSGSSIETIGEAFDSAIDRAMESEAAQIAGLKHQLKTLMDAAQFLSAMRLPKRGENLTKRFITGILRIAKMNGGNLTYDKNDHTGTLADVYEFFRARMPPGSWTDLSPSTLQNLKSGC